MSARGPRSPDLDALANNRTSVLPFLPTLVTALAVGVLASLCRQPKPTDPVPADAAAIVSTLAPGIDPFHRASDAAGAPALIRATVTFGQLYPLAPTTLMAAKAANARVAGAARRACGTSRCEARRAEPVRSASNPPRVQDPVATSAIPLPFREETDRDEALLPEGALPYTPTAATVIDTVRALGNGAAILGSAVLGTLTAGH